MLSLSSIMYKQKSKLSNVKIMPKLGVLVLVFGFMVSVCAPFAKADRFDSQIQQLKNENSQKEQKVNALQIEAGSLQETIAKLENQIAGLQSQIRDNQAKNEKLQKDIEAAQLELEKQKNY